MNAGASSRFGPPRRAGRLTVFLVLGLAGRLVAAVPTGVAVHSRSGQFIVHAPAPTPPSLARVAPAGTETNRVIVLYPDPLAVSCERIKAAVLAELGWPDRWRGKVHVTIDPRAPAEAFPAAVGRRFSDGWHFSLRLPQEIEPPALIRGVVHAVLLEWTLRAHPGTRAPEIPLWLLEALTGQVLSRIGPDPVASPNPVTGKYGSTLGQLVATLRERGLAEEDRKVLDLVRTNGLLSFEDISLPTPERLTGPALEHYRACCQVLFVALRNLPQGRARLTAFLARLPQYLNWQTAFLDAYAPIFPRLLEVEKWWALVGQRLGASPGSSVSAARLGAAWLEDLLQVEQAVRTVPGRAPERQTLTFQQIVTELDFPRQQALLAPRVQALYRLAQAVPGHAATLARAYGRTLESYLTARLRLGYQPGLRGAAAIQLNALVRSTLSQLDALDARRREVFSLPASAPTPPAGPAPTPAPASSAPNRPSAPERPAPGPEAAGVTPPAESAPEEAPPR